MPEEREEGGRQTKAEKLAAIHYEAIRQFDRIQSALKEEREQCLQDRRFSLISGAQWEGSLGDQFANKPRYEVNKIDLSVQRIVNDFRNNRITADFISKNGVNDDDLADICDGLFRADEQDSQAEEAYYNAFEEAVRGGYGAFRLYTDYEDEYDPENEKQRIRMEPIYDADTSVYFDLDARRQDKSDAKYCFVVWPKTPEAFKEEWPDDDIATLNKSVEGVEYDWYTSDVVYVAEYYMVEEKGETMVFYTGPDGKEVKTRLSELTPEKIDYLEATGSQEVRRRRIKARVIHKYILSGNKVLEDCGIIAGKNIPIIPVYWKRLIIDNTERCIGHVRYAKDAQRLKNMLLSKLAEISSYSSIRKPILTPEQVAGFEDLWADDNIKNYPYMLVNPMTNLDGSRAPAGPLAYTESPNIPEALAALIQLVENDTKEILGSQQEGEKIVSNISGKAVELAQSYIGMQTFIGLSNFAMSVKRAAEVWLSMAKDVYVEEGREMKTISATETPGSIKLGIPGKDAAGALINANDFSRASFDVAVSVGPSTASRREAIIRQITGMMQFIPQEDIQTKALLVSMWGMNIEGEGLGPLRDYSRQNLVQMGLEKPTDEEKKQMQEQAAAAAQRPDPNAEALLAMAQKSQADAQKALAETEKIFAQIEQIKADTLETLASVQKAANTPTAPAQ